MNDAAVEGKQYVEARVLCGFEQLAVLLSGVACFGDGSASESC
jgi:hypothetical protein